MRYALLIITAVMAVGLIFSATPAAATPPSWSVSVVEHANGSYATATPEPILIANYTTSSTFVTAAGTHCYGLAGSVTVVSSVNTTWTVFYGIYDGTSLMHSNSLVIPNVTPGSLLVPIGVQYLGSPGNWVINASTAHYFATAAGHTYYLTADAVGTDANGAVVGTYQISVVMREAFAAPATINWLDSVIWIFIIFTPAWLLNLVFPRYGVILGLGAMMGVVAITEPTGLWVAFLGIVVIGATAFTMRSD